MKYLLALAVLALTHAQKGASAGAPVAGKGKAPAGTGQAAPPQTQSELSKLDADTERKNILAMQVQSTLEFESEANGGSIKGTVVELVLQSLALNFTATCNSTSRDFLTCANGYVSLDCKFGQSAASFGGVNCIPYLSQCPDEFLKYCQSKVPASEKCKATDACGCAQEPGCGWSRGHMMCLVNREQVSCGDCPTMPRCGKIDCPSATRPCDCAALGGACGWSTSSWRCESGKDTDCNECAEQTECGGPGLVMVHQDSCPATVPAQLSPCKDTITCPYDKKCCPRCAGAKQVCSETRAECDGMTWELRTSPLVCPDCEDYYYDDFSENAPSEPLEIAVTQVTSNSAVVTWKAPQQHFKAGVDGYSVAYTEDKPNDADEKLEILDIVKTPRVSLTGLLPNKTYKLSILPVTSETETVGIAGILDFKTLPAAAVAGKAKAKAAKAAKGKVVAGKAKAGR